MLRIRGSPLRLCAGLTRRDFMHVGGLLGMGLGALPRAQANSADRPGFGRAKSCILLFPYGSPSQHDTFDAKPDAPSQVRGELTAIDSSVPGLQVCELLPKTARIMDRVTVIRSMTHPFPVHGVAYALSGIPNYDPTLEINPRDARQWPFIGSCVDYVLERRDQGAVAAIPRNMQLPWRMNSQNGGIATAGPFGAFLGSAYDPIVAKFEGEASRSVEKFLPRTGVRHVVADCFAGVKPDGVFRLDGTELAPAMTIDRFDGRRALSMQLDMARATFDSRAQTSGYERYREMAYSLMSNTRLQNALNIRREPESSREQYGMTLFGQGCLAARRLVEAGARFVTVFWDEVGPINTDWDTHWNQLERLKGWLMPGFDHAFSGLILDLERRGILDETLVVWMSEHGRSPRLNREAGRDHWSRVYSIVMAGAGVKRGDVVGASDRLGGDVLHTPISPKDILATIYHLLGIDPETTVPNRLGRPLRIAGEGTVRREIF